MSIDQEEFNGIIKLRMAVGCLGENADGNWWSSSWSAATAYAFLSPIYGGHTDVVRYHGLVEAARRVHDTHIGVGRVFHLFRLPERFERRLHDELSKGKASETTAIIRTREDAEAFLEEIGTTISASVVGPVHVGCPADLARKDWLIDLAGRYLAAFKNSTQVFPYFAEGR